MKLFEKIKLNKEWEIRFLGLSIAQYGKKNENGAKITYFDLFPKSFEHKVCDMILSQIPAEHDLIIIARAGLGEAYILNFMLSEIIFKYKAKSPCIVANKGHYAEVFKMFSPDVPFYKIDIEDFLLSRSVVNRVFKYKNKILISNPSTFSQIREYFETCEKNLDKRHYLDVIKKFSNVKELKIKPYVMPDGIAEKVFKKFPELNFDNFVFLVPEAKFIKKIQDGFWEELEKQLKAKGYSVFYNSSNISISEALYIAMKAKAVVSLRCGFSEIISIVKCPKYILYTDCKFHNIPNLKEILTLSKYPNINKESLFEYSIADCNYDIVLQDIMKNF